MDFHFFIFKKKNNLHIDISILSIFLSRYIDIIQKAISHKPISPLTSSTTSTRHTTTLQSVLALIVIFFFRVTTICVNTH